jgi:hypothetical protein
MDSVFLGYVVVLRDYMNPDGTPRVIYGRWKHPDTQEWMEREAVVWREDGYDAVVMGVEASLATVEV